MAHDRSHIFISSSSDLAATREEIAESLEGWLKQVGRASELEAYLWDKKTEGGVLLSDRMHIQPQLPDPLDWSVPFTICLFGERCGVPLQDKLPPHWMERLKPWRASEDKPGLLHPWPDVESEQSKRLDRGDFPLTGTVFELISACAVSENDDNLVIGYSASNIITDTTTLDDIFFNDTKEKRRLVKSARSPRHEKSIIHEKYTPQIHALLNLLRYFIRHHGTPPCYGSEDEMKKAVVRRAKAKLRDYYGLESEHNPFKLSLEHWTVEDPNELPGRNDLVDDVVSRLDGSGDKRGRPLVLITGPSGCGKSSVLQRGALGSLQRKGMTVLPIRPTDLEGVAGKDRLDVLWNMICDRIEGCYVPGLRSHKRDEKMACRLIKVLGDRNIDLVIGIDQFEEMLDEMALFRGKKHRTRGWWLMLRFLRRIATSPRVGLIATLESTRRKTFDALDIKDAVGLRYVTCDADVSARDIERIAQHGFEMGGLALDAALLQEIQDKWNAFTETSRSAIGTASPLPLACLWFAQLYDAYEDRADRVLEDGAGTLGQKMARAAAKNPQLTLEDIGGPDEVSFEGVIGQLADEAWREGDGEEPPKGDVSNNTENYAGLILFLDPLVALEGDGHLRLLSAPPDGGHKYLGLLYKSFGNRRLLVPAGRRKRVRLVHQAVIDQWTPARNWFSWRKAYLETEHEMRDGAKAWTVGGRKKVRRNAALIQKAAQVLSANRTEWRSAISDALSKDSVILRDYCVAHFSNATDALEPVVTAPSDRRVISIAVQYHLVDLLKALLKSKPDAFFLQDSGRNTLLNLASDVDGPVTEILVSIAREKGDLEWVRTADNDGWHPIATAIQEHANGNFRLLIDHYDNVNATTASDERKMLTIAAVVDNLEIAENLMQHPEIDPDVKSYGNFRPIDHAARWGSERVFSFLLENVSFLNENGFNPIHHAAFGGHVSIIQASLNSPHLDEETKEKALVDKPNEWSRTPLMEAVRGRRPEALAELLNYCDPSDPVHEKRGGMTLLHQTLSAIPAASPPSPDEQHRAKKCIEILLADGRLDVMALANGRTAHEVGAEFKDARRILRQHMPLDYDSMSASLRREDLLSSNPRDYRRLIEQAPQVLCDKLGDLTGLDLLIKEKRTKVLTEILQKNWARPALLHRRWPQLIALASDEKEVALRRGLVEVIPIRSKADLSPLLDAAMRDDEGRESDLVSELLERGIKLARGTDALGLTVFHSLAIQGNIERFEQLAIGCNFKLPLDDWGRVPSKLASTSKQEAFAELEALHFKGRTPAHKSNPGKSPYLALERTEGPKLEAGVRRKVLTAVRKIDGMPKFDARKTKTTRFNVPFYKDTELIVVTNTRWKRGLARICFLLRDGNLTRLAGKSPPIHEFNAKSNFRTLKGSVLEYLAFFCFFVRGEDGPFLVVDSSDNIFIPESTRTTEFNEALRPIRLWGRDKTGGWRASACIYYGNALFFADFLIQPGGMIKMMDDTKIATDFEDEVDAPLAP